MKLWTRFRFWISLVLFAYCVFVTGTIQAQEDSIKTNLLRVSTNKSSYDTTELIEVVLLNTSKQSIFSLAASASPIYGIKSIQKWDDGLWDNLSAYCKFPYCTFDADPPMELVSNSRVVFEWNPRSFIKDKVTRLDTGTYRLEIDYMDAAKSEWRTSYSNKFQLQ